MDKQFSVQLGDVYSGDEPLAVRFSDGRVRHVVDELEGIGRRVENEVVEVGQRLERFAGSVTRTARRTLTNEEKKIDQVIQAHPSSIFATSKRT